MDSWFEAIKQGFSGILNWGTLIGLVVGALIYLVLSAISIYVDNKEYGIFLCGSLQLRLGRTKSKCARKIAKWIWRRSLSLYYQRQNQLIRRPINGEKEICSAFWNISQIEGQKSVKRTILVLNDVLDVSTGILSKKTEKVAKAALEELKVRQIV